MSDAGPRLGRPPARLVVGGTVAAVFLVLPPIALVVSAPWDRWWSIVTTPEAREALWLSAWTSTIAAGLCLVLGLPLAWLLARVTFPGRRWLRALVTVPLVLPPVVAGVALLSAFGRHGLVGAPLRELFGTQIPYTTTAVILAHTFVAMPFFVISLEGALRSTSARLEVAAASLGADRWTTFRRVTVPLAMPGLVAGLVLAWARSLGEFGATITFAGNYPGTTRTMPLDVYAALQADRDTAVALSVVLLAVCVLVLVALRERWWGVR
ncbi:MAG: molybdate ABC transporter permease subunit [Propionibacteriales bacterium]|nr:molybdate ABC transporter permease subunit [Propionibacteriales bacterium]